MAWFTLLVVVLWLVAVFSWIGRALNRGQEPAGSPLDSPRRQVGLAPVERPYDWEGMGL